MKKDIIEIVIVCLSINSLYLLGIYMGQSYGKEYQTNEKETAYIERLEKNIVWQDSIIDKLLINQHNQILILEPK